MRDSRTGDGILKFVNGANTAKPLRVKLAGAKDPAAKATKTVLAGPDMEAANVDGRPPAAQSQTASIAVGSAVGYEAPSNSLTVIRVTISRAAASPNHKPAYLNQKL